jgi:hypothetical protein
MTADAAVTGCIMQPGKVYRIVTPEKYKLKIITNGYRTNVTAGFVFLYLQKRQPYPCVLADDNSYLILKVLTADGTVGQLSTWAYRTNDRGQSCYDARALLSAVEEL